MKYDNILNILIDSNPPVCKFEGFVKWLLTLGGTNVEVNLHHERSNLSDHFSFNKGKLNNKVTNAKKYMERRETQDVNKQDGTGVTLLSRAIEEGKTEIAKQLIRLGASVNSGSCPPILYAIYFNRLEMLKLLLLHGANPNKGTEHENPLDAADVGENKDMASILKDFGAVKMWKH